MTKDPDPADNDTAFNSFRAKLQGNKVRDGLIVHLVSKSTK